MDWRELHLEAKIDRLNVEDVAMLTPVQEGILAAYLSDLTKTKYYCQIHLTLGSDVDASRLERALLAVIEHNPMLRCVFRWKATQHPVLITLKKPDFQLRLMDLRGMVESEAEHTACEIKQRDLEQGMDLSKEVFRATLLTCKRDASLIIGYHHIAMDGWSNGVLLEDLLNAYRTDGVAQSAKKAQFGHYSKWLSLANQGEPDLFWGGYVAGYTTVVGIPALEPLEPTQGRAQYVKKLSLGYSNRIRQYVKANKLTIAAVLYPAFGIFLQKINGTDDVIFGTPISERGKIPNADDIVGPMISTVPVRITADRGQTIAALFTKIKREIGTLVDHSHYPYREIVKKTDVKEGGLFHTLFAVENYPLRLPEDDSVLGIKQVEYYENNAFDCCVSMAVFEDAFSLVVDYDASLYEDGYINDLMECFLHLVDQLTAGSVMEVSQLTLLPFEQKRLLEAFNQTEKQFSNVPDCLIAPFTQRAMATPGQMACLYADASTTYGQLWEKVESLAHYLRQKGVGRNTIVAVSMRRSLDMLVGIYAILVAGGAYLPIFLDSPEERVAYLLKDSGATILLTDRPMEPKVPQVRVIDVVTFKQDRPVNHIELINQPGDLAYVIYTSGSTGAPKGVMIDHKAIVNRLLWMSEAFPLTEKDVIMFKTPYSFDVSVWEIFWFTFGDAKLLILPHGMEKDVSVMAGAIADFKVSVMHFVPSMLNAFLDTVGIMGQANRCISLRYIIASGEALSGAHVSKFESVFGKLPVELFNLYGPTEAAVDVTYYNATGQSKVFIGKPVSNIQLFVLDHHLQLLPAGVWGELYIAGVGLARGYMNNPVLTLDRFLWWKDGQRLYQTGDIARWRPDGNIEFLGRKDHQIKIRGMRIELGEIEACLCQQQGVLNAAVTVRTLANGKPVLYAYVQTESSPIIESELRRHAEKYLPEYMIPDRFVQIDQFPLMSNGKMDRKALEALECRQPDSLPTPVEDIDLSIEETETLRIWREVLAEGRLTADSDFLSSGGDSILATTVANRMNRTFPINLIPTDILRERTPRNLAALVKNKREPAGPLNGASIEKAPPLPAYVASDVQKRFYILDRLSEDRSAYHIHGSVLIKGSLDIDRLEHAFQTVVATHEVLRTTFYEADQTIYQKVHPTIAFSLERIDGSSVWQAVQNEYLHWISLGTLPLLHMGIYERQEDEHVLLFDIHHIIADGRTLRLLWEEVFHLYAGHAQKEPVLQYRDYSAWQLNRLQGERGEEIARYWRQKLSGELPLLAFPTDNPRKPNLTRRCDTAIAEISQERTKRLLACASEAGCTFFNWLLAAYYLVLYRYTGQADLIIGTPVEGRIHKDLEGLMGALVNTLALRMNIDPQERLQAYLRRVQQELMSDLEHQDYPFDQLVAAISPQRTMDRSAVFDAMLTLVDHSYLNGNKDALVFSLLPQTIQSGVVELDLEATLTDRLTLRMIYDQELYKKDTIETLLHHYINILTSMMDRQDRPIAKLEMLDPKEVVRLLSFSGKELAYPKGWTLADMMIACARDFPEKTAIVCGQEQITYSRLQTLSDNLAAYLSAHGVRTGVPVPLIMRRSIWMIVGALGVWKSGGYFIPIDATMPSSRIRYIVEDVGAGFALCDLPVDRQAAFGEMSAALYSIDECAKHGEALGDRHACSHASAEAPAYLIYTSGSTGKPKGVLVAHESLVSMTIDWRADYQLDQDEVVLLQLARFSFDVFIGDMARCFANHGKMVICQDQERLELPSIASIIETHRITLFETTPAYAVALLDYARRNGTDMSSLKMIIMGSDLCKVEDYRRAVLECGSHCRVVNSYGLTEATIDSSFYEEAYDTAVRPAFTTLPIGRPMGNVRVYVVDQYDNLQPIGVKGEILIGGVTVAIGYVNDPEATARSFTADPFLPGERVYRTGDVGSWMPDGNIVFWGRNDNQLKIRGNRVDAAEVQKAICAHPSVTDAIVHAIRDEDSAAILTAYVIVQEKRSQEDLTDFLLQRLPEYMIPARMVFVDRFPLSDNGKIDLKMLALLEGAKESDSCKQKPESGGMEAQVLTIWSNVLKQSISDPSISFFEAGGNSLLILDLFNRLQEAYDFAFTVADLFNYNTVSSFCRIARQRLGEATPAKQSLHADLVSKLTELENEEIDIEEFKRFFGM